ncbi:radical SAM protein [Candidatus Woesearchaeota archaeon]|mgnify:CR=1 FL=1|jgi:AdoMet-dependent heme synthase|nr:radical SAM protein [Candidatus Woesearchaeota archaeon]MBT5741063.1 radical SAM protein [Candidatus Woesearchaeota archaeon]
MKKATLLISSVCNHKCDFCLNIWHNSNINETFETFMSFEKIKESIDKLSNANITNITICGGEPLLHPDFNKIIDYIYNKKLNIRLQTNGVFLNKEKIDFFKNKISEIEISLHGTKEIHNEISHSNSFEKIIKNVNDIIKNNILLTTNFVINKNNFMDIENYIYLLNKLNVKAGYFTILYKAGLANRNNLELTKQQLSEFIGKINDYSLISKTKLIFQGCYPPCELNVKNIEFISPCGAGKDEIAIQPNGTITLCPAHPKAITNIFTINQTKFNKLINNTQSYLLNESLPKKECNSCSLLKACRGGCVINRQGGTENILKEKNNLFKLINY